MKRRTPCTKRWWPSRRKAQRELARLIVANPHGTVARAYRCQRCGRWHLTSRV